MFTKLTAQVSKVLIPEGSIPEGKQFAEEETTEAICDWSRTA